MLLLHFFIHVQLMALRKQYANEHGVSPNISLTNTYRPVQPLNDRTVYFNTMKNGGVPTATMSITSSAPGLFASVSLVAMVIARALISALDE